MSRGYCCFRSTLCLGYYLHPLPTHKILLWVKNKISIKFHQVALTGISWRWWSRKNLNFAFAHWLSGLIRNELACIAGVVFGWAKTACLFVMVWPPSLIFFPRKTTERRNPSVTREEGHKESRGEIILLPPPSPFPLLIPPTFFKIQHCGYSCINISALFWVLSLSCWCLAELI